MSKTATRKGRAKSDGKYTIHPVCQLIPPMSAEDRARLKAGIERDGEIRVPIVVLGKEIIDGRNRWEISQELRINCPSVKYKGPADMPSLAAYVMSLNVERRHMTNSQLTACAAELARIIESSRAGLDSDKPGDVLNLARSKRQPESLNAPAVGRSNEVAARAMGVSTASVTKQKAVMEKAPDLHEKVKAGELTVHAATQEMKRREAKDAPDEKPEPVRDGIGKEITNERIRKVFTDKPYHALAKEGGEFLAKVEAFAATKDGKHIDDKCLVELRNVVTALKFWKPYCLCQYCGAGGAKGCAKCNNTGFISKKQYDAVPEADRCQ